MRGKNKGSIQLPLTQWEKWLLMQSLDMAAACSRLLAKLGWQMFRKIVFSKL